MWRQVAGVFAALRFVPTALAQVLQPATFVGVSSSVVRVEAERQQGGLSVGSGGTVGPAIVVTNCHVIRDAATIRISGGGSLWEVTGQFADANHDVGNPLHEALPFWQRGVARLPYFMRAAPLHAEGRWTELVGLADRWSTANPRDANLAARLHDEVARLVDSTKH